MVHAEEHDKTRLTDKEWAHIFTKLQTIEGILSIRAGRLPVGILWKRYSGCSVSEGSGDHYRRIGGNGIAFSSAMRDGQSGGFGGNCMSGRQKRLIYKMFRSIAR